MPEGNNELTPAEREAEAKAQKAETEAKTALIAKDKAELEAEKAKWSSLIPDLSKITQKPLDLKGDALVPTPLSFAAMDDAVSNLIKKYSKLIQGTSEEKRYILVANDLDLASDGLAYVELSTALDDLNSSIASLSVRNASVRQIVGEGVAAAIVSQIPALISLLQTSQTVTTVAIGENDLAAVAAVIAGIRDQNTDFVHDQFRAVTPKGGVFARIQELFRSRANLVGRQAGSTEETQAAIDSIIKRIDEFVLAARTVPASATRTPLANALLYEQLYPGSGSKTFTHVLYVKSQGGRGQQVVSDLPLWSKDTIYLLAEVAITFLLVDTETGSICASGTVSGIAQAYSKVGEPIEPGKPPRSAGRLHFGLGWSGT